MAKEREAIRLRAISPLHLTNKQTAIVKVAVLDSVRRAQLPRTIVLKERASKRREKRSLATSMTTSTCSLKGLAQTTTVDPSGV